MNRFSAGRGWRIVFTAILVLIVVITSYPVFWVIMSSLKTAQETAAGPPYALPSSLFFGNYETAIVRSNLARYFLNSTIVAVGTLGGIIALGAPAAFAISKLRFRQNEALMNFFLVGMMIPVFACLIPMFQIYNAAGLRNTYLSLILPQVGFSLPMCIYLYTGFMRYVPSAMLEAATIDGAGSFTCFIRIIFPMAKNSTITVIIYNFVSIWNEFTYANTFMTKGTMKTLPVGLNDFVGEMGRRDWGATFAAITLAILPTLILYFFMNRSVMEGMAAGAVKD